MNNKEDKEKFIKIENHLIKISLIRFVKINKEKQTLKFRLVPNIKITIKIRSYCDFRFYVRDLIEFLKPINETYFSNLI